MNQLTTGNFGKQADSWVDTGLEFWLTFTPERGIDQSMKREFGNQQETLNTSYATTRYPMSLVTIDAAKHRFVDKVNGRVFAISVIANVDERNRELQMKLVEIK